MRLAKIQLAFGCLLACSIALSTVHPVGNPHSTSQSDDQLLEGSDAPVTVRAVLEEKCGNCHSHRTRYPLYTHLAPITWLVDHDVVAGRAQLDMSRWQFYSDEERVSALTRIASEVRTGQMPPRLYVLIHQNTRLSGQEQQVIYDWAKSERKQLRRRHVPGSDQSSVNSRREKP